MRVALALGLTLAGTAVRAEPPVAVATRLAPGESIRLDGRLDDAAWTKAPPISGFLQRDPAEGQPAVEPTEVRFLFEENTLFVGARMHSKDASKIRAPVSRRDDEAQADSFGICLDTFHDKRTAYAFVVTAAGVRLDGYFSQDEEWSFDDSLDLVWQAAVSRDEGGWSAEMRIPFTQLRFPHDTSAWGLNARRSVPARNEEDLWALVGKQQNGWASRFGTLTGISGIRGGRRRELLPFVAVDSLIAAERDPANPFDVGARPRVRAGGDFKLAAGPSLMLEGTVAPDFGQVEADPAEVNLSAFETFFPEKRPFFVEGAEMLQPLYGQPLFYSRRIGAAPRGPAEGAYVDYPRATTILGAAKLTGRTGGGTSIGALAALTGREAARVAGLGGPTFDVVVAPPSGYFVGHALHPFGGSQSTISGTATMVQRNLGAGGALASLLPRGAYAVEGESVLRFNGGEWQVMATGSLSRVEGEPGAILRLQQSSARYYQRPGSPVALDPFRRSLSGWAGELGFERTAGKHWLGFLTYGVVSPGFEINDLGQLSQADQRRLWGMLRYRETRPGSFYRDYGFNVHNLSTWSYAGDLQASATGVYASLTWRNFWTSWLSFNALPGAQDFRAARGGPSLGTLPRENLTVSLGGPSSSPWRWDFTGFFSRGDDGGRSRELRAQLSARPSPRLRVALAPHLLWQRVARQYVSTVEGGPEATLGQRYVFGVVDRRTFSAQLRLTAAFTPNLTFDLYAEPFAASGAYPRFGEMVAPRSPDLRFYGEEGSTLERQHGSVTVSDELGTFTFADPDFGVTSFRANAVLRWEYRPGSTLYVVWQQNRYAETVPPREVTGADVFRAVRAPGDQLIAVKASFWIPLR